MLSRLNVTFSGDVFFLGFFSIISAASREFTDDSDFLLYWLGTLASKVRRCIYRVILFPLRHRRAMIDLGSFPPAKSERAIAAFESGQHRLLARPNAECKLIPRLFRPMFRLSREA